MRTVRRLVGLGLAVVLSIGVAGVARGQAVNDLFVGATVIVGSSAQVTENSYGATAEENEPCHFAGYPPTSSVWWSWEAPASGAVTIHTLGSDFDTVLAVYTGTVASVSNLTQVTCDDDWEGHFQSLVTFSARSGTVYWIAVDCGFWDGPREGGAIMLSLCMNSVAASNGTFAARAELSGLAAEWSGNNSGVIAEMNTPTIAGLAAVAPVWWSWTAPKTCIMEADTRGSGLDTVLGVYTGAVLGALTEVAANDNRGTNTAARVWWAVEAGTTYQIAVDGVGGAWGGIRLKVREVERPAITGGGVGSVRWGSLTGESYRVSSSTNLVQWGAVTSVVAGASETLVSGMAASTPRAFYRIERYLP